MESFLLPNQTLTPSLVPASTFRGYRGEGVKTNRIKTCFSLEPIQRQQALRSDSNE